MVEVGNREPFGAKWSIFCRLKVRSYVLAANVAGTLKVAPLRILKFPVILPHKFLDAGKFNLRFSDASEITEIADKLRWYRYQKGLRQRDVADYAGIDRSTYVKGFFLGSGKPSSYTSRTVPSSISRRV